MSGGPAKQVHAAAALFPEVRQDPNSRPSVSKSARKKQWPGRAGVQTDSACFGWSPCQDRADCGRMIARRIASSAFAIKFRHLYAWSNPVCFALIKKVRRRLV